MKKILKRTLLWFWQFPQHVAALIIIGFCKVVKDSMYKDARVYKWMSTGLSLGQYIFVHYMIHTEITIAHEYGHSIQSRYLGPFYLPVVGLVSISRNIYARVKKKNNKWYYAGWPESWADKLGNVVRKELV